MLTLIKSIFKGSEYVFQFQKEGVSFYTNTWIVFKCLYLGTYGKKKDDLDKFYVEWEKTACDCIEIPVKELKAVSSHAKAIRNKGTVQVIRLKRKTAACVTDLSYQFRHDLNIHGEFQHPIEITVEVLDIAIKVAAKEKVKSVKLWFSTTGSFVRFTFDKVEFITTSLDTTK